MSTRQKVHTVHTNAQIEVALAHIQTDLETVCSERSRIVRTVPSCAALVLLILSSVRCMGKRATGTAPSACHRYPMHHRIDHSSDDAHRAQRSIPSSAVAAHSRGLSQQEDRSRLPLLASAPAGNMHPGNSEREQQSITPPSPRPLRHGIEQQLSHSLRHSPRSSVSHSSHHSMRYASPSSTSSSAAAFTNQVLWLSPVSLRSSSHGRVSQFPSPSHAYPAVSSPGAALHNPPPFSSGSATVTVAGVRSLRAHGARSHSSHSPHGPATRASTHQSTSSKEVCTHATTECGMRSVQFVLIMRCNWMCGCDILSLL
jgi:hypothetical protein